MRSFGRDSPDPNPSALAPRESFFLEGNVIGLVGGPGSGLCLGRTSATGVHVTRESGLASHCSGIGRLFCHEFHRGFHLYVAFRGEEGDALGGPGPNSGCGFRVASLVLVALHCLRKLNHDTTRLSEGCSDPEP